MRALSIRQPFAELILRGIKTAEFRSRPTSIIGERFLIYASKGKTRLAAGSGQLAVKNKVVGDNIAAAMPPAWMVELAEQIKLIPEDLELPTGVIVGSAVIEKVVPLHNTLMYAWHLTKVERAATLRKPNGQPQPVWWRPG